MSSLYVPTFTSGSGVGIDSTHNSSLTESDPADAVVGATANVITIAAGLTVSRQLIDLSSPDSRADQVLSEDLGAAHGAQLDSSVISGGGGTGELTGLINTSNVLSVPAGSSVAGFWVGIAIAWRIGVGHHGAVSRHLPPNHRRQPLTIRRRRSSYRGFGHQPTPWDWRLADH